MISKNELWNLRKEIVLGSLFYNDYSNSFGIPVKTCCDFFDGFLEMSFCQETDNVDIFYIYEKYDNPDSLWEYYLGFDECF